MLIEGDARHNQIASGEGIVSLIPNRAAIEACTRAAGFERLEWREADEHHNDQYRTGDRGGWSLAGLESGPSSRASSVWCPHALAAAAGGGGQALLAPPDALRALRRRQAGQDPRVCALAWRAQGRLHHQWQKLVTRRGKPANVARWPAPASCLAFSGRPR